MSAAVPTHVLGYPRIGPQRELKFALEAHWRGDIDRASLGSQAAALREAAWARQAQTGCGWVTVGDFSLYDHVLDAALLAGLVPLRFGVAPAQAFGAAYFDFARGNAQQPALDMTKWFDTNYHHLVPELDASAQPTLQRGAPLFAQVRQARALGHRAKAVLVGPLTLLWLSRSRAPGFDRLRLLPALAAVYAEALAELSALGVEWVQIDEPALCLDLPADWQQALPAAYAAMTGGTAARPRLLLATYFGEVALPASTLAALPVDGIHLDLVRAPQQLDAWLGALPGHWVLSAGAIDGRNVWRADLRALLARLQPLHAALGERLWLAPSCSLLHMPVSLAGEDVPGNRLDAQVRPWLAFAEQKLDELRTLARALAEGEAAVAAELAQSDAVQRARRDNPRRVIEAVRKRVTALTDADSRRASPFAQRYALQQQRLKLPLLPTTTIGSFPQTADIRAERAAWRRGQLRHSDYLQRMREAIADSVRRQEALGLDVLVHGEAERNDMVEYFGEQLWGYTFSSNGWVQSYGSRCVKPPILWGDVLRPEPMTVDTARHAQILTAKPMKGMLTGPVTMLQWSFVRDDLPREQVMLQLALAVRDEVNDLQNAGIAIVQIDEPALREGLPLRQRDWPGYLAAAVRAFGVAAGCARDDTQIHTHMCYSEFGDILPAIAALDADVITIETARSHMALLDAFADFDYPNAIGPGVYDIHSPRVPPTAEMETLLRRAAQRIPVEQLWVNPDCGLKTRGWAETEAALAHMVQAARRLREEALQRGYIAAPATLAADAAATATRCACHAT